MPVRKTYQSLGGIPLSVDLPVGGTLQSVDFTGGMKHPVVRFPKFSTMDPTLQKALENYPGFKKSFDLISTEVLDDNGMPVEGIDPNMDANSDDLSKEIVIKNLGAAKSYLKKEFNVIADTKSKREDVNELFAQQGIKLILETDKNK